MHVTLTCVHEGPVGCNLPSPGPCFCSLSPAIITLMEQYGARGQSSGPGPPPNNGPFSQSETGVDIPNGHTDSRVCECVYLCGFLSPRDGGCSGLSLFSANEFFLCDLVCVCVLHKDKRKVY